MMELVFLCLSLLVHQSLTQESCKCLDASLCGDPAGCGYRCRAGFAGKFCSHTNLGYNLSAEYTELFDGDFSTCSNRKYRSKITFSHPIDIDKIRVHREDKRTGVFFVHIYQGSRSVNTWTLPKYKKSTEGEAAAVSFPVQTDVTAIRINNLYIACEVELTAGCPRQRYGRDCNQTCYTNCKDGECDHADGSCLCRPGWTGSSCGTECPCGKYGQNCSMTCSSGCSNTCDKATGQCQCKAGWVLGENLKCDKKSERTHSGYIMAGVLLAVIAVLAGIIAVGIFKNRTLRNRLTKAAQGPIDSEIDGKNENVAIGDIKAATDNECYENVETVSKKEEESDHYVDPAQV